METATNLSGHILAVANIAKNAGVKISRRDWLTTVSLKKHAEFGTSSVADADKEAERWIKEELGGTFSDTYFVGEESSGENLDPTVITTAPRAFIIDPRDGTTEDGHELPFWCVSIGVLESGVFAGGAVYAPDIRGGMLIVGERGNGVHIAENGGFLTPIEEAVHVAEGAKPMIHLGLDVLRSNKYHRFLGALQKDLKPRGISGSGALGLALVAAGRIDAIVQSPQMPWDVAAGIAMILERGLALYSYRVVNGRIKSVELSDPENFRTDVQTLGLVAGKAKFVEPLSELLVNTYEG